MNSWCNTFTWYKSLCWCKPLIVPLWYLHFITNLAYCGNVMQFNLGYSSPLPHTRTNAPLCYLACSNSGLIVIALIGLDWVEWNMAEMMDRWLKWSLHISTGRVCQRQVVTAWDWQGLFSDWLGLRSDHLRLPETSSDRLRLVESVQWLAVTAWD